VSSMEPGTLLVLAPVEACLFEGLTRVEASDYVGAVRVGRKDSRPPTRSPPAPSPARTEPARPRRAADDYIRQALALYQSGRYEEALREARAGAYANPRSLHTRMFIGQILLRVDPPRGRRVLEELSQELESR